MELSKETIQEIFNKAQTAAEALLMLYKQVFPEWDDIQTIEGWPRVGEEAYADIVDNMIDKFGSEGIFILLNKGFGILHEPGYRVDLSEVKIIKK